VAEVCRLSPAQRLALARELLAELGASRGQFQVSALIGELGGDALPEAARCTGDDDDPAVVRGRSRGMQRRAADQMECAAQQERGPPDRVVTWNIHQ
jgi:hypothetical protein